MNLFTNKWVQFSSGILLGIAYWIFDSFVDAYIFHERSFAFQLFTPDKEDIYMRISIMIIIVLLI